ncbi:MAG: DUF2891 domain-containing protein [Bacteroidales bacterium]|nr:DUF2891 domain-containing protein [Bacteroidales bacterium]
MKSIPIYLTGLLLLAACGGAETEKKSKPQAQDAGRVACEPLKLTLEEANKLAELPLSCIQIQYPNKPSFTLESKDDLKEPCELSPAFYGCFDWHSAVHGHWSLVKLLKEFPELEKADLMETSLRNHLSKPNILAETRYFKEDRNKSFERTYGWAWLLKLAEELHTWDSPLARELEQNLEPLTEQIVQSFIEFLPKLRYPIRVGEHTNTAFGLSFALDYADATEHAELGNIVRARAKDFYLHDQGCPLDWEPSGYDFLSPCLEELDLMRKVLNKQEFDAWLNSFLPELKNRSLEIGVAEVSDRTDGKLVHLDGLNFSRAWVLYGLAKQYPEYSYVIDIANKHMNHSIPNLLGDGYEGGHWLGTFAIYALGI